MSSSDDEQLAEAILAYLSESPDAMDTAEGVTEWWLMRQHVRVQVEAVARVLKGLVARGVLEHIGSPDRPRYRLRRN